jgi:hypothetical protein
MSKKLYVAFAPLLAVAAFAVMPAVASAFTEYGTCGTVGAHTANCPGTEHFTPFPNEERVSVYGKKVSTTFVLENEAETAGIECSKLADSGFNWNVLTVGHSFVGLAFQGCKGIKGLATTCGAGSLPNGNGIIEGDVSDIVLTELTVEVKIEHDFNVECGTTNLGPVTGAVVGSQPAKKGVLKFAKAKGLKFAGENAQITGENETKQAETNKAVVI